MTILLPRLNRRTRFAMRPVYAASEPLRPASGGPALPSDRTGDHWALEFDPGPMMAECGLSFVADLVRGRGERIAVRIPQPGIDTGAVGLPVVDGDGQSGATFALAGFESNYEVRKGLFLSVVTGGQRYAYMVTGSRITDADGKADVPVWPMMRVPHEDGDVVEIAEPWIEGLLSDGGSYEGGGLPVVAPGTVVIEESE